MERSPQDMNLLHCKVLKLVHHQELKKYRIKMLAIKMIQLMRDMGWEVIVQALKLKYLPRKILCNNRWAQIYTIIVPLLLNQS